MATLSGAYPGKDSQTRQSMQQRGNKFKQGDLHQQKGGSGSPNRLPQIKSKQGYHHKQDKSPYRHNQYEVNERKLIAHKKRRYREKQKEQQRKIKHEHHTKLIKKYNMGESPLNSHKKTNLKKIYGMGD